MLKSVRTALQAAVFASVAFAAGSAFAVEPTGLWYDHTGRGAVEITKCGDQLCGRLVWLKDAQHAKQVCGIQILGEVKPMANGAWDNGWIYDPERDSKFSVELTPMGASGAQGGRLHGHQVAQRDHDVEASAGKPEALRRMRKSGRACGVA